MSRLFWNLVSYLLRALFSLRYSIEIRGSEKLKPENLDKPQGILFMPNHSALMDPLFLFFIFWPKFRMRPLVVDYIYRLTLLKPLHMLVQSISIPNFETGVNEYKQKNGEKAMRLIAEGLKKKDNFILYPSGRLKSTGKELIGGASGAHEILKECPDCNIVLVRTTGLWGSSFSRAILGRSPELSKTLKAGLIVLLKNFIFFAPRRKIIIEIEPNPKDLFKSNTSRIDLNRFLEKWYNQYPDSQGNIHESEPLNLVSYSRFKYEVPKPFKPPEKNHNHNHIEISEDTRRRVSAEIKRILDKPDLQLKDEMNLAFDLGMDSLNIAELITYLTKNFEIRELHPENLETVQSVLVIAEEGGDANIPLIPASTYTWREEKSRPLPALPIGRTISEAFLNSCQRMKGFEAVGDDTIGVLSYDRMKKAALVLAQKFQQYDEKRVAVLLPASIGAYVIISALQLAGKTPVMLNWTLGPRYLEEMMQISGAKKILTSYKFLDRLANVQFGKCLDQLICLEDIRSALSLKMKLKGLFLTKCGVPKVLKTMGLDQINEEEPCVILFTSGTEASPKGVPLSHKNIISNQRSAMQCIDLNEQDVIYGILPPFHSFGFSVAGLFPILGGIKVAYYPDPTDSFALAEGVNRWKISLFCSAPSFLKGLFSAAKPDQIKTVRYFVSGAEKAPDELYKRVEDLKTKAKLLEGYGITECSPILSINRPHMPKEGVGRVIPDIELITIHPETLEKLPERADGEICVRGPNIFNGYLGNPRSPFIEIDHKMWYRTGDLGHLDQNGCLVLSGRLKRFTKIGGEMISLGAVEQILIKKLIEENRISPDVPSLAVIADEKEEGKPKLILFSVIDIHKEEANKILTESGFSNLVKISDVKKIDDIPIMGAGKTDYRALQSLC